MRLLTTLLHHQSRPGDSGYPALAPPIPVLYKSLLPAGFFRGRFSAIYRDFAPFRHKHMDLPVE